MSPVPARLWHLPHLARILWAFTRATPWLPRARTRRDDLVAMARAIRRGWVLVVRDVSGPVGFIMRDGDYVHALYVHPRAHGRGVGKVLLNRAKQDRERLDLRVLAANRRAVCFYRAQGFVEVAHGHGAGNDEGMPDVGMIWLADEREAS